MSICLSLELELAVVPIAVNAGTALLPAIVAGFASVAALIFKPRELCALFVKKPIIPALFLGLVVLGWGVWSWMSRPDVSNSVSPRIAASSAVSGTDWTKVALEIIQQEARGAVVQSVEETKLPATQETAKPLIFRGDVNRSGHLGEKSPSALKLLWEQVEDGTMHLASPLPYGEAVFGALTYLDPPKSYGILYRLDANTGRELWRQEYIDSANSKEFMGFFSSPAVTADGSKILIGQGLHADSSAELLCMDANTGKVLWTVPTPLHIESSPAIEEDIVVVGAGAIEVGEEHKPQGDPGFVMAVRISTGKELWRYPLADPESSPAIQDGVVYIGSGFNGSAVAALRLDPEFKGERLLWKTPTPHPATGPVTVSGGLILVGCGNADFVQSSPNPEGLVIALDRTTGELRWQVQLPDAVLGAVAVKNGVAVAAVRNGELVAMEVASGKILWRQEARSSRISENAALLCSPAFTGELVYATTSDGFLGIVNAKDGSVLERHYINAAEKPGEMGLTVSSPFISGNRVFVGSETGGLRAFTGSN